MEKNFKSFLMNPWIITIVGGVIVVLLSSGILSLISKINLWEAVKLILLINIPFWVVLLAFIVLCVCYFNIFPRFEVKREYLKFKKKGKLNNFRSVLNGVDRDGGLIGKVNPRDIEFLTVHNIIQGDSTSNYYCLTEKGEEFRKYFIDESNDF
jgi:succinate dehydrogenase hydrophobic anchor subunit